MTKRTALVLLLLLLLALGWLGFVLGWRGDETEAAGAGAAKRPGEIPSAHDPEPATLRGAPAPALPAPAAPASAAPAPAEARADGVYRIVGRVVDVEAETAAALVIRVRSLVHGLWASDDPPIEGAAQPDGTFDLDVSTLRRGDGLLGTVRVEADHPGHVVAKRTVDLSPGPGVYAAELRLAPAACATGRVVDDAGAPVHGARVCLYALDAHGPVEVRPHRDSLVPVPVPFRVEAFDPLDAAATSEEGRYLLRFSTSRRYVVIAARAGRLPHATVVDLEVGRATECDDLVLRTGEVLEGLVRCHDRALVGAEVYAETTSPGSTLDVNGIAVSWHEGQVHAAGANATTDAEGHFRMDGLAPGVHTLAVDGGPELYIHPSARTVEPAEVHVPDTGVVVRVIGRTLDIITERDGQPVDGIGIQVSARGGFMTLVTEDGGARIVVDPTATITLDVQHESYETDSVVIAPDPGSTAHTERIELTPSAPGPRLIVRLRGEGVKGMQWAHFTWTPLHVVEAPPEPDPSGAPVPIPVGHTSTHVSAAIHEGRCELDQVAAGRVRIRLHPNGSMVAATGVGYLQPAEAVVSLENGRTTRIQLEVRPGGRLRLAARSPGGELVEARCTIRNEKGEAVDVRFVSTNESMSTTTPTWLGRLSPSTVDPPLDPGTYEVELEADGYDPWTGKVRVKINETTDFEIRLTPIR